MTTNNQHVKSFAPTTAARQTGKTKQGGPSQKPAGASKTTLEALSPFAKHNTPGAMVAVAGALVAASISSIAQGQTMPSAPGYTIDVYANTPFPARLAVRSDGTLFAGNNPATNGNGPLAKIDCGGAPVLRSADVFDPDVIAVDERGFLTGFTGSAITAGGRTTMTFWRPDGSTSTFNYTGFDPDDMTLDSNGNLLIAANGVFRYNGTTVTRIVTTPLSVNSIAVDSDGAILTALTDGRVQVYSANGQLLVQSLSVFTSAPIIRKDISGEYGGGFVVLDGGLWRLNRQGQRAQIGSGFRYGATTSGMAMDESGALFISENANSRVLRVGRGPHVCGPTSTSTCATGSASVTVTPVGTGPFTFAWQVQDSVVIGGWRTLTNSLGNADPIAREVSGVNTDTLRIMRGTPGATLRVRALVTNATGTTASKPATIAVDQCDCIDYNNDGIFPSDDDLIEFLNVLAGGACSTGPVIEAEGEVGCNDIDFNNDGIFPSDEDLLAFLRVMAGGSCI